MKINNMTGKLIDVNSKYIQSIVSITNKLNEVLENELNLVDAEEIGLANKDVAIPLNVTSTLILQRFKHLTLIDKKKLLKKELISSFTRLIDALNEILTDYMERDDDNQDK